MYNVMFFHLFTGQFQKTGKGNKRKQMEGLETNKKFKNTQAADDGGEVKKMTRKERKEMKIMESKNKKKTKKENHSKIGPQKQFPQKKKAWGQSRIKKKPGRGRGRRKF